MELDDLKTTWAAHTAALARSVAISERVLHETFVGKVRRRIAPVVLVRAVEIAAGAAVVFALAPIVAAHAREPRYLLAGVPAVGFIAALTAASIYLLVRTLDLDYRQSVLELQRHVEHLKRVGYRTTKWAILGGVFVWLPLLLLGVEAVTGAPVLARIDLAYLAANLAFGAAVIATGHVLSRRYVEQPNAHWLIDAFAGWSLNAATRELAELARFQTED